MSVVQIDNLRVSYGKVEAVRGISFDIPKGEVYGFIGPNGAGKTTTLKLICTLLKPQSGRVEVFGSSVRNEVKEIRQRIGFMPDHFSMYRQMTVFEYLDFFGAAYGLGQTDRDRIINDVLTLTDMDGRQDSLVSGLSRGMQQRVSLARVLINDPDLLLLDEPASGLDPRARIELMEILQELRRMGKTIFISSHILSELAELCDSVTIIDRGTVKYSGAMDSLLDANTETPTWRIRLGGDQTDLVDALSAIKGISSVEPVEGRPEFRLQTNGRLTTNDMLRELLALDRPVLSFTEERKHLNQAFMDLTERGVRT
ncbi:UNVERIFIED_CONTAM: hypothetical protein GTU68_008722 [Idotea baltica]|nr:hypothetical protein [Idotea baltica]